MEIYDEGSAITLTVAFDVQGITSSSYKITDENGQTLLSPVPVVIASGETSTQIVIDAPLNTLAVGVNRGVRVVELLLTTAERTHRIRSRYVLQRDVPLVIPVQSYVGFDEAFMIAVDLTPLVGWTQATDFAKKTALIQAHANIDRFCFKVDYDPFTMTDFAETFAVDRKIGTLSEYTLPNFLTLPTDLLRDLKIAQILEADDLLGGFDEVEKLRREGVKSKTTGESSVTFMTDRADRGRVSGRAMAYLRPYIQAGLRIVRS